MQLVISPRAPNPRRVRMFIAEKGSALPDIAFEAIDLGRGDHRSAEFKALNPLSRVPVLRLDDGRALAETRAICTYLEGLAPEPNLMGHTFEERAFIEMADRRMEISLLATIANWIRHGHPGLANLEQPQFPDFSASQGQKMRGLTAWLEETREQWEELAAAARAERAARASRVDSAISPDSCSARASHTRALTASNGIGIPSSTDTAL